MGGWPDGYSGSLLGRVAAYRSNQIPIAHLNVHDLFKGNLDALFLEDSVMFIDV